MTMQFDKALLHLKQASSAIEMRVMNFSHAYEVELNLYYTKIILGAAAA